MKSPLLVQHRPISLAVREPVRIDLAFHGSRLIQAEFAGVALVFLAISVLEAVLWFQHRSVFLYGVGTLLFASFAANAFTFWGLARQLARHTKIPARSVYTGRAIVVYSVEAVDLLLVPLLFPVLALVQRHGD